MDVDVNIAAIKAESAESSSGKFADFEIIEQVAQTSMGIVYKANQKQLQRECALKVLTPQKELDDISLKRFLNEAKLICLLDHPHIVKVFSIGFKDEQSPFISMEWLQGKSLDKILTVRRLKMAEIRTLFLQIIDAIEYAHSKGIIHRDLKPSNIFVMEDATEPSTVVTNGKLLDFGIAHMDGESTEGMKLTRTGVLLGTPAFMSPEQTRNEPLDIRTDIYSLGLVMYEALTGCPAFSGDTALDIMYKQSNSFVDDTKLPKGAEFVELNRCILKCLEKNKENRFQSMKELLDSFENSSKTLEEIKIVSQNPTMKHSAWAVLALALFIAAASGLYFLKAQDINTKKQLASTSQIPLEIPKNLSYDKLFKNAKRYLAKYQEARRIKAFDDAAQFKKLGMLYLAETERVSNETESAVYAGHLAEKIIAESNRLKLSVDAGNTAYNAAKLAGVYHLFDRNVAEAENCFERAAKKMGNNPMLYSVAKRYSAYCDYLNGDLEQGISKLREITQRIPGPNKEHTIPNDVLWEHSNICMDLGTLYLKAGNSLEAKKCFDEALRSENAGTTTPHEEREFEVELGLSVAAANAQESRTHLEKIRSIALIGPVLRRSDPVSRSLIQAGRISEIADPAASNEFYIKGLALGKRGDHADTLASAAEEAFASSIENQNEILFSKWKEDASSQLGVNYLDIGAGKAALNDGSPMRFEIAFATACFRFLKRDYREALSQFQSAATFADTGRDCEVRYELMIGCCLAKLNRKEEAVQHFKQAFVTQRDFDVALSRDIYVNAMKEYQRLSLEPISGKFNLPDLNDYKADPKTLIKVRVSDS